LIEETIIFKDPIQPPPPLERRDSSEIEIIDYRPSS
jgi:hypothetical protein